MTQSLTEHSDDIYIESCNKTEHSVPNRKKAVSGYEIVFSSGEAIFVTADERSAYSLYEGDRLRLPLVELLEKILYQRMMLIAIPFVMYTRRTEYEVLRKLSRREYADEDAWGSCFFTAQDKLMNYLRERHYVDDVAYCRDYISYAAKSDDVSLTSIKIKLLNHGINSDIVESALAECDIDEYANACVLLRKKLRGTPPSEINQKKETSVMRSLCGKGFSFEQVRRALDEYKREQCSEQ